MYFIICILPIILLMTAIGSLILCVMCAIASYSPEGFNVKVTAISLSVAIITTAVLVCGSYNTETFYPQNYDVARMAEDYNADVKTGSRERLIHYHWFGDYWVYTIESPEMDAYAEYTIASSERN